MEYDIVYACGLTSLREAVEKQIADGWEPQGGIAVVAHYPEAVCDNCESCYQAMIKHASDGPSFGEDLPGTTPRPWDKD